jgi:hypothetical protein
LKYQGEQQTVKGYRRNASFCLCILFIVSLPILFINEPYSDSISEIESVKEELHTITAIDSSLNSTEYWEQACSSVIVTGNASKDGRAILMKNRDWPYDPVNIPIYVPSTAGAYAFIGVNTNTMGINEKGLAVMNTYLPALAGLEPIEGNLLLNQKILERYESVNEVAHALNNSRSLIGPVYRSSSGAVATCIGIIDRFGDGAFFEVSNTRAYVQYVMDGYDTRANHPRIFPPHASGPSGRDQFLLDALDEVYEKNGYISWEDVMQNVSRYIHHKELGSTDFSIDGEACNPNTVATMVAVSGDSRYDGKLNCMWTACGSNPIVGVFVPTMVCAESTPASIASLSSYTSIKYISAQAQPNPADPILLNPERVRAVQEFAFFAEDYTVSEYDRLMSSVPEELSDSQITLTISAFIEGLCDYATEIFIEETTDVEVPPLVNFPTPMSTTTTPQSVTSPTSSTSPISTTDGPTNPTSTSSASLLDNQIMALVVGFGSGFVLVMIAAIMKRRLT